jgi:hypothetical protein
MIRAGAWLAALVVGLFAVAGAASTLTVDPEDLAAGRASVTACDPDGIPVGLDYVKLEDGRVVVAGATVGAVDGESSMAPECDGAAILLTLSGPEGVTLASGSGTIPLGGGPVHLGIVGQPVAEDLQAIHVALLGPAEEATSE